MRALLHLTVAAIVAGAITTGPVAAQRLDLDFLPPDFPPTDICRASAEVLETNETQVSEEEGTEDPDEIEQWIAFLKRDIRTLSRADADRHFDFIDALIGMRATLDPGFVEADETFARIDLHIDAGRLEALEGSGMVAALAAAADDLSQTERVRLAQYFMTGTGVAKDVPRGEAMMTTEAYSGNANALLELLRLQLAGAELADWFETPERTATLALGGKLGQLNRGMCTRAEFIARAYVDGDLLEPKPHLAYAWRKFAADQGGQRAAWRVVEHMLTAPAADFDRDEVVHYLRLAVDEDYLVDGTDVDALRDAGAARADEIADALARRHNHRHGTSLQAAPAYFELPPPGEDQGLDGDGPELAYLREITTLDDVPGAIWTRLADEVIVKIGRWAGEDEARAALHNAVEAGDPVAYVKLARFVARDAFEGGDENTSENLLLEAVDRFGYAPALEELDEMSRCYVPTAPLLDKAENWRMSFEASHAAGFTGEGRNYATLSRTIDADTLARVHRRALRGNSPEMAGYLHWLETAPHQNADALRFWTTRIGNSKRALELYAYGAFELARTPQEAEEAVAFLRRARLAVGPAMDLELSATLTRFDGRSPEAIDEVLALLEGAGRRGEGASIRLLHRLRGENDDHVYRQFADAIEARGDFLALMFAAPYVDDVTFERYMARAASLMNCGTKDMAELADAFAARGKAPEAMRWLQVGLAIEGGHSMSRLRTKPYEMNRFNDTFYADPETLEGAPLDALAQAYGAVSDTGNASFDRHAAAEFLVDGLGRDDSAIQRWALKELGVAERGVRRLVGVQRDLGADIARMAEDGLVEAQFAHAMRLRDRAETSADLRLSAMWFARAADAGHAGAMVEYGYAIAHGLGVAQDPKLALIWLRRAESLNAPRATELKHLVLATMDAG